MSMLNPIYNHFWLQTYVLSIPLRVFASTLQWMAFGEAGVRGVMLMSGFSALMLPLMEISTLLSVLGRTNWSLWKANSCSWACHIYTLIFSACGGSNKEATTLYKHLASLLADHCNQTYNSTMNWVKRFSFHLLAVFCNSMHSRCTLFSWPPSEFNSTSRFSNSWNEPFALLNSQKLQSFSNHPHSIFYIYTNLCLHVKK